MDPQAIIHNEGIIGTASIKSLCFISTIPVHFIHNTIKVSKYYFLFISLSFIFHIILQSFKETPPSQLFPGAIPLRGINTENSVIRGSAVTLKDTNPVFGSLSTRTSDLFVLLSPGEKKDGPNQLFFICIWWCIWSWLIWVSVKIVMSLFLSAKLKCHILLQAIFDVTYIVIYHAVTIKKSEKKSSLIQFYYVLLCNSNDFRHFKLVKRNKFLWKKEWNYKNMNFGTKGKFILRRKSLWIFRVKEKLILWISGSKGICFSTQEIDRKMIFA